MHIASKKSSRRTRIERVVDLAPATLQLHLPVAAASVPLMCLLFALRSGISRFEDTLLLLIYGAYIGLAILAA